MESNMKSISAKSGTRNFKQLAIDHAEKIVLGVVVLFVLLAISPMMTAWSRYAHTPEEMADLANQSAKKVAQSVWPKEEEKQYPLTDTIGKNVQELQRPLEVARFDYSGYGVTFPLYPKQEPIKEPKFFAVDEPIATASRTLIALRPEGGREYGSDPYAVDAVPADGTARPFAGGRSGGADKKDDDSDIPPEFRRRTGGGRASGALGAGGAGSVLTPAGGGAAGMLRGRGGSGGLLRGRGRDGSASPLGAASRGGGAAGYEGAMGSYGGAMGAGGTFSRTNARGMRFVAIRGVFPLRQEIIEFRKALHAATDVEVADRVMVIDFEIERQMAVAGADPWTGPWVKLDIQRAKDVIDEADDFDPEVVAIGITDPVITMGLLRRVVGEWGDLATHPWVKDYKLSPEEREEQERLNSRTVEAWEKYLKNRPKPLRKKGFADRQRDLRGMASDLRQSPGGLYDTVLQDTATDIDPKKIRKRLKDDLKRQTA